MPGIRCALLPSSGRGAPRGIRAAARLGRAAAAQARRVVADLVELLLPPACARCSAPLSADTPLCLPCAAALPRLPRGDCPRCRAAPAAPGGTPCPRCRRRSPLAAQVAEAPYAGEVEQWVRRFKYPPPGLAGLDARPGAVLSALLCAAAARLGDARPQRVVPVPQGAAALRRRGFNPAGVLAAALARAHGLRCDAVALRRVREGPSQTSLSRAARRRNVAGAFRARPGLVLPAEVWLVDDVVTTGATLEEAARALRRAGARRVVALCVARTPDPEMEAVRAPLRP